MVSSNSPSSIWYMYDLGVSAGATTLAGSREVSVVIHTPVSFGIGGRGRDLCQLSWSRFCFCLNSLSWRQNLSRSGHFGLSSSFKRGKFVLK